jgi:polyribonucleotide nucleotidyltransferase
LVSKRVLLDGDDLIIEANSVASISDGSVLLRYRDNVVLVTANADFKDTTRKSFLPLTVDFVEKFYASGKVPGGFFKREGKPSVKATLSARLIDRAIRPMFEKHFFCSTHVVVSILSYDGTINPVILGIIGASQALMISAIPFNKAIAASAVGLDENGDFISKSTKDLDLIVAGSKENLLMLSSKANEVDHQLFLEAIEYGIDKYEKLLDVQYEITKEIGKDKFNIPNNSIEIDSTSILRDITRIYDSKESLNNHFFDLIDNYIDNSLKNYEDNHDEIRSIIEGIARDFVRNSILESRIRMDGRSPKDVRDILISLSILPKAHGSSIFKRGNTESLGTITLGTEDDQQIVDGLDEEYKKKFFLHYNFPAFCTGSVGYMKTTSRRELGHGNLAENGIIPVMPNDFPYAVRAVADTLASNGSSSMATVCSISLALMDAGVPIQSHVAGIAMGLIDNNNDHVILSDITGTEDRLGDLDMKITSTRRGITAVQMDIKNSGIKRDLIEKVLIQANDGIDHILNLMESAISKPREEMNKSVPKYHKIIINKDKISTLIGTSGKNIKHIIELTGSSINIDNSGEVSIFAQNKDGLDKTLNLISSFIDGPKVGSIIDSKIKKIISSGAFVEIINSKDGFIHISEFSKRFGKRIDELEKHLNIGDSIKTKIDSIDEKSSKIKLVLIEAENE